MKRVNGKEATVVLAKCSKTENIYGNRVEKKDDGKWHFTWSFKINNLNIKKEKYDLNSISGSVLLDDTYKGCPYCDSIGWNKCGKCGKLSCSSSNYGDIVKCMWCGNTGVMEAGETFDLKGEDF